MRQVIVMAALVVALAGARAEAQNIPFGNSRTGTPTRASASTQQKNIGPSTYLGSTFRLSNLFRRGTTISNRTQVGTTKIPTPGTEEYLKAFGYKKLY